MKNIAQLSVIPGLLLCLLLVVLIVLPIVNFNHTGHDTSIDRTHLSQQVGQLMIVGFSGTNRSSPGFRRLVDNLEKGLVGGALFLAENITSRTELVAMVQQVRHCACALPPLIAIDEEGGAIERLSEEYAFPHIQSAAKVGSGDEENARRQYRTLAQKLFDVGFNINFAPVVDLNKNPNNPIIGAKDRSFSRDPYVVALFAKIFIEEHHAFGILTTLKHFPGHGSSSTDTHLTATDVGSSWSQDELIPYQRLLADDLVDSVMVGHLINEREWGGVATQDGSTAIHNLLRKKLKYNGVVISDDLTMSAITRKTNDFADVLISSLQAGVDILLIAHPVKDGNDEYQGFNSSTVNAIIDNKLALQLVQESWERVTSLKSRLK